MAATAMEPAETPAEVVARLKSVLLSLGVTDFAVTGGLALGFWAEPRQTMDIDLVGTLPAFSVDKLLALHDGIRVGPEPLPDIVRFRIGSWDVDLFTCKSEYDRTCLARAIPVEMDGQQVRVVTAEDLIIHKFVKLRLDARRVLQDAADLRALLRSRGSDLDRVYLARWLSTFEAETITLLPQLADDELVRRLAIRSAGKGP